MMSKIIPSKPTLVRNEDTSSLKSAFKLFTQGWSPRILAMKVVVFACIRAYIGEFTGWDAVIILGIMLWWPFQEWWVRYQ